MIVTCLTVRCRKLQGFSVYGLQGASLASDADKLARQRQARAAPKIVRRRGRLWGQDPKPPRRRSVGREDHFPRA